MIHQNMFRQESDDGFLCQAHYDDERNVFIVDVTKFCETRTKTVPCSYRPIFGIDTCDLGAILHEAETLCEAF